MSEDLKSKIAQEKNLTSAEADKVLDKAAELMMAAEGQGHLSKADLKAGAAEVGIDPRYVDEALAAVRREEAEDKRSGSRNRALALLAAGVAALLLVGTTVAARSALGEKMAVVKKTAAQLKNVKDRRARLLPELARVRQRNDPNDSETVMRLMDEITGSANRITTEQRRYDEAVVDYETAANSPPYSWVRPLTGMPGKVQPPK